MKNQKIRKMRKSENEKMRKIDARYFLFKI
jgi:hypothetical protein